MDPAELPEPGVTIPVDLESTPSDYRIVGKWSAPLTQLDLTSTEKDEWRRELLTGTHQAITTAIQHSDLLTHLSVETELDQIGPHAEAYDVALGVVSGVAANLATDLVKSYGKKGVIAFANQLKRIMGRHERLALGKDHHLEPILPPEFLVLMALEEMGPRLVHEGGTPRITYSRVDPDRRPPFMFREQLYKIELRAGEHQATCWITDRGDFHRIEFNGFPQEAFRSRDFLIDDEGYPSQDGIDRSDHVAVLARLSLDFDRRDPARDMEINNLSGELPNILENEVRDALRDMQIHGSESVLASAPYQVGPAAGGIVDLGHHIITLLQHSDQLTSYLDDVPTYYFYYRMFVEGRRRIRKKIEAKDIPGVSVIFVNTEAEFKALAALYVKLELDQEPTGEPIVQCLTEEFYAGYMSPAHPTESLEYLIIVPVSTGTFRFRVLGDGHIKSLVFTDGNYKQDLKPLENLDDLEWEYDPDEPQ